MRVAGVATVSVRAMSVGVHMTSSTVNVIVRLRRHRFYSTRVAMLSAVDGVR